MVEGGFRLVRRSERHGEIVVVGRFVRLQPDGFATMHQRLCRATEQSQDAARGTDNVLYPMRDALRLRATGGEVSHALRDVWGLYVPHETF